MWLTLRELVPRGLSEISWVFYWDRLLLIGALIKLQPLSYLPRYGVPANSARPKLTPFCTTRTNTGTL